MGGSKTQSGPTQSGKFIQGALTGGLFPGSEDALVGTQKEGALIGAETAAGMFGNLNDVANSPGFFSGVQDPSNPFNNAFTSLNASFGEGSGIEAGVASGASASGATAEAGQIEDVAGVITEGQSQQAIDKLLNPDSLFDTMSGGPIVDAINERTDAASAAFTEKMLTDMTSAQERAYANLVAGGGFVSSSAVVEQMDRVTRDVMNDIAVFESTLSLQNTQHLGDLVMQDIQNQTNAAATVLAQAMVQRGQDVQTAIAQAEMITQAAIATAQNETQASIASAQNATNASIASADNLTRANIASGQLAQQGQLGLLGLGLNDNQFSRGMQFDAANKPIDVATGIAVGSNVSRGSSKTI